MKKLLALFLLIVALSVAAPGFLGMQAEARYDAVVTQLQAAGYRVADRTYARGWFTSSARLQLEVPLPADRATDGTPPRVMVKTRAVHGPFLGDLERPFGLARLDSEVWLDSAPLIVGGVVFDFVTWPGQLIFGVWPMWGPSSLHMKPETVD